jgi:2-hydroxy-3-oxopropionate reductase
MRYGFLGMGIMGSAMARNLVKAGLDVTVWNRDEAKCDPLVEQGARQGRSPAQVAENCSVTFAMLSDPAAAEAVCIGPDGVLEGMGPGKSYIDMSTIDPQTSRDLAEAVTEQGGRHLEAPVSGTKKPAEDGTLIILTAGDRTLYDEVSPVLDLMGKKRLFLGETGQAARMKLVVNMIMGGMMTAFSEGLTLADACRLSTDDLLDVLAAGALANPMFAVKGPLMTRRDFAPAFPLKHMEKDLRLAVELGGDFAKLTATAEAAQGLFALALERGLGDEDFSAIHKVIAD